MDNQDIDDKYLELAEKWLNGTITPVEEKEFFDWYNAAQDNPIVVTGSYTNEEELKQAVWQQIQNRKTGTIKRTGKRRLLIRIAAAACITALIAYGYLLYRTTNSDMFRNNKATAITNNDIAPGSNKATLTLADGSVIVLDSAKNGRLADQGRTTVLKVDDGKLAYEAENGEEEITFNTLTTPRGGQYRLTLPDGSQIWLNAQSSIRFPTTFTGHERKVSITGEAYFEVAKDSAKPFRVDVAGKGEIEVLGTHFDVSVYDDEPTIKATLLEGSIKLLIPTPQQSTILSPGQQAQVNKSGIHVNPNADLEQTVAWKNGMTSFNNMDVKSVMRQLSRWYDIDVSYENGMPDKTFTGEISRYVKLSEVLNMLEYAGVHFKISGRTVIVVK